MESGDSFQSGGVLYDWILQRVAAFLDVLNMQLPKLPDRLGTILGQSMVRSCHPLPTSFRIICFGRGCTVQQSWHVCYDCDEYMLGGDAGGRLWMQWH